MTHVKFPFVPPVTNEMFLFCFQGRNGDEDWSHRSENSGEFSLNVCAHAACPSKADNNLEPHFKYVTSSKQLILFAERTFWGGAEGHKTTLLAVASEMTLFRKAFQSSNSLQF